MSATYRIEMSYDRDNPMFPYQATIVRLSDEWPVQVQREATEFAAESSARTWIRMENDSVDWQRVHFVDDQGRDAEAPQPFTPRRHVGYCFTCDNGNASTFVEGKCDVCGAPEAPQSVKVPE